MSLKESLESTEKLLEPFPAVVSIKLNYLYKLQSSGGDLWLHK